MSFANFPFEFFFQCHMGHSHFSLSTVDIDSRPVKMPCSKKPEQRPLGLGQKYLSTKTRSRFTTTRGLKIKCHFPSREPFSRDQGSSPPFKGLCWLQLKAEGKEHNSNVPMGRPDWVWSTQCIPLCCSLVLKLYFIKTEDTPPPPSASTFRCQIQEWIVHFFRDFKESFLDMFL